MESLPIISNGSCYSNGLCSSSSLTHQDAMTIFKLSGPAIQIWKQKYLGRSISYKLCLVDIKRKDSEVELKMDDYSSNFAEYVNSTSNVQIAVLNENECNFVNQQQFGRIFNANEYVFLKASLDDLTKWAYMMDFYVHSDGGSGECADHIGYSYILPMNMHESNSTIKTMITGINHKPIGHFTVDFLIVKPLQGYSNTLVGCKKWSDLKSGMEVGHRGAGKWRRNDKIENVLENTIASFNYAATHGADMVELDVHLSKDKVPVIYHDFSISISIKKKITSSDTDLTSDVVKVTHGVKELTLQELQMLKLSPVNNNNHDFSDNDPLENQPFPTLEQVLNAVPQHCGFNVEIKYPMRRHDGQFDGPCSREQDLNEFVDIILGVVMEHAGSRKIIFSCFNPDIAILLRLKQNMYPVLFLTQGMTKKYAKYLDPRTSSVQMATFMVKCFHLWGVNCHVEDFLVDRSLVQYVKKFGITVFTWGDDINSTNVIHQLKNDGVDGIIYDKIDVYNTKFVAENPNIDEIKAQQEEIDLKADQMSLGQQTITQQSAMVQ